MLWVPLPVVLPLLAAALLSALHRRVPRAVVDGVAIGVSVSVFLICGWLVRASAGNPIVYWFGGWFPRGSIALGISFAIDPIGAGLATLTALLVTTGLVFSWRYFKAEGSLFHVLMLVFLAALCGFALTGDLFNLFVFFELMGAASYALCGYKCEEAGPIQGAINFAVTNTVGAFFALSGIALLYGRTGALNMAQVARALGSAHDRLVIVAFVLIACGFLIKAALVPFHFWLADAHAVAPTPVSILFSGVMVEAGLYAVARVYGSIFSAPFAESTPKVRAILLGFGALTAVVGAVMCTLQSHLKRLLAFSTISHMGLMVIGFGLLTKRALAGTALYVVGHGLVKASLFLSVGVLLHRFKTVNELELRGRGRVMPVAGVLFVLGGLGLVGLPPFVNSFGDHLIIETSDDLGFRWVRLIMIFSTALTGGTVLRAAGRIFFGWGARRETAPGSGGEQTEGPETRGPHWHVPASMLVSVAVLLMLGLTIGLVPRLSALAETNSAWMLNPGAYAARVLDGTPFSPPPSDVDPKFASVFLSKAVVLLIAVVSAAAMLARSRRVAAERTHREKRGALALLRELHSGAIGDYIAWMLFGFSVFGGLCALYLR